VECGPQPCSATSTACPGLHFVDRLIDDMPGLLSVKDVATRRYVRVNPTFCHFMGKPAEALLGRTVAEAGIEDAPAFELADDAAVALPDEPQQRIFETGSPHGRRWLKAVKTVVRGESGQPSHILTFETDITELVEAERALGESRAFLAEIVRNLPCALSVKDADTRRYVLTHGLAKPRSDRQRDAAGCRVEDLYPPDYAARIAVMDDAVVADPQRPVEAEIEMVQSPGPIWHRVRKVAVRDADGACRWIVSLTEDVTEQRRTVEDLRHSEASLRRSQAFARIGSWWRSLDGGPIEWSAEMYRIYGRDPQSFVPTAAAIVAQIHEDDRPAFLASRKAAIEGGASRFGFTKRIRAEGGIVRHVRVEAEIERDAGGRPVALFGTTQDVGELIEAERRIRELALHDALTGLANRRLFDDRLGQAVREARRPAKQVAVLCLDLDDFKGVNDTLGHAFGDSLLRRVAERLRTVVRDTDTVGRLGGDEFAVILRNIAGPDEAQALAERAIAALGRPFLIDGRDLSITVSIGIVLHDPRRGAAPDLLRFADLALYDAKAAGRGCWRFFSPEMEAALALRMQLEAKLRLAIASGGITLAFQPQICLRTGRVVGVEALARWEDPDLGPVPPDRFIGIAETIGQIVPLGEQVLRAACRQARAWIDAGLDPGRISVNLSPAQFAYQDLVEVVRSALAEAGLPPWRLEIEVTESMLMRDPIGAAETLARLRRLGVGVALDDFGIGYSSLGHLKRFPLDKLKLDRSFVQDLPGDAGEEAIARTILSLGHILGLVVVAEGIETEAQRRFLAAEGCDQGQGFLFAPPLAASELARHLRGQPPIAGRLDRASAGPYKPARAVPR
jgi:diguanylate cyclase (GGDEF)-like protein/PAS domain S-box-containing protein